MAINKRRHNQKNIKSNMIKHRIKKFLTQINRIILNKPIKDKYLVENE